MLDTIIAQLVTTGTVVAVAGFFMRSWFTLQLDKLKKQNAHELSLQLEAAKAEWAKDIAKLSVHEPYLHSNRTELIEDLFEKMIEAEFSLQHFLLHWWTNTVHGSEESTGHQSMSHRGREFCEKFVYINGTLHQKALYFDDAFIEKIISSYKPFFELINSFDYENMPEMPPEFHDVINAGRQPRKEVINYFREALGVI